MQYKYNGIGEDFLFYIIFLYLLVIPQLLYYK